MGSRYNIVGSCERLGDGIVQAGGDSLAGERNSGCDGKMGGWMMRLRRWLLDAVEEGGFDYHVKIVEASQLSNRGLALVYIDLIERCL